MVIAFLGGVLLAAAQTKKVDADVHEIVAAHLNAVLGALWVGAVAFTLQGGAMVIGVGAWLGTIMLFNVWVFIWPNQKKVLGLVEATADQIAKARKTATLASRTNAVLSIPMLMSMVAFGHGGFFL